MELTVDKALQQGIAAHKEGKLQDAERLYRAILQAQPNHPDANHNLGVLAVAVGKPAEAVPLFKLALGANRKVEQFWLSYLDALIKLERFYEAKRVLVECEKSGLFSDRLGAIKLWLTGGFSGVEPSQDQLNYLLERYQAGKLEEAEALASSLTQQFPKHPFAWKLLGAVLKRAGRANESLLPMQKSVELSPKNAEAHSNLGVTLKALGRLDEAEASCRKAIALKPDYSEAHSNLGITLQALGRLDEAEASCRQAKLLNPDLPLAHYNLGNVLLELGSLDEAEASYRQAIALSPDFADGYSNLGVVLKELGRLEKAEASHRKAIALKPQFAEAYNNLGTTLQGLGRLDEAEVSYRRAIALKPDFAEAHRNVATTMDFSSEDELLSQMRAVYRDPSISDTNRCQICFALAKASDDIEDCAAAFQFYAEGNALRKKHLGYDKARDQKLFVELKATYPSIAAHTFEPEIVAAEPTPCFILGLPRSGTTLVEQVISSHPMVTGAGELPFALEYGRFLAAGQTSVDAKALTTFREQYLDALQQRSQGRAVVIDKKPQNFLLLGLIATALPEAKIIHVKRDPAAVCWANYTQYFINDALGYCYSLDDILHFHELYIDLMKFWHQALPKRIYDLTYELLTESQDEETRNLISHLGLDWDDACLSPEENRRAVETASNVQIRQKVYQGSSEKWKRYRPYLDGALDHFSAGNN